MSCKKTSCLSSSSEEELVFSKNEEESCVANNEEDLVLTKTEDIFLNETEACLLIPKINVICKNEEDILNNNEAINSKHSNKIILSNNKRIHLLKIKKYIIIQ